MLAAVASASPLTVGDVLRSVFSSEKTNGTSGHREECDIHVIPQGDEPRWIIVGSPKLALPVLRSWAPWKLTSRLRWGAVQTAANLDVLSRVPGVENSSARIDTSYWRASLPQSFPENWSAVIHVGSLSHTRKSILFLIDNGEHVVWAAKSPLVAGSAEAILNEGAMLDLLRQFECVPKVLFRDRARGVVTQSWLEGRPVSRGFTHAHLELLSSLACGHGERKVSEYRAEISSDMDASDFPFDRSVLMRGLEFLDYDVALPRFVEHRDFAPWNLKWIRESVLGLLDWEWAVPDGLPWQDICRYFYLDDVHFNGAGQVWAGLTSNPLLSRYRKKFEIPPEAIAPLTMQYLLRELLMEWNGGNHWLAEYAYKQVQALLEAAVPARA